MQTRRYHGLLCIVGFLYCACSSGLLCMDNDNRSSLEKRLDDQIIEEKIKREILRVKLRMMYENVFGCEKKFNELCRKANDICTQTELTLVTNKSLVTTKVNSSLKRVRSVDGLKNLKDK